MQDNKSLFAEWLKAEVMGEAAEEQTNEQTADAAETSFQYPVLIDCGELEASSKPKSIEEQFKEFFSESFGY